MTIIEKSITYARSLVVNNATHNQHFAFLFIKNKLISVGQNNACSTDNKGRKIAKKFGAKKHIQYPFIHAEIDAISRIWGKVYLCKKHRLVSVRLNKHGQERISKPCADCGLILSALGIRVIYFDGNKFIYE